MEIETVTIPRKEYEELLDEVGILRSPKMMDAIRESDEAKRKGIKPWKLSHP
jgi:PHD/YefM family antitoxin component YafN of YafNO toxin-antitoxin module